MKRTVLFISAAIALIAATFQVVVAAGILSTPAPIRLSIPRLVSIPSKIIQLRPDYDFLKVSPGTISAQVERFRIAEISA